jgi:hypothetical protein
LEEAKLLEWAGVGFSEEESYRLSKSLAVNFLFAFKEFISKPKPFLETGSPD